MFSGSIKYEMSVIILEKALLVSFRFFGEIKSLIKTEENERQ